MWTSDPELPNNILTGRTVENSLSDVKSRAYRLSRKEIEVRIRLNSIIAVAAFVAILSFDLGLAARQAGQGGQAGGAAPQAGQRGGGGGQRGGRGANANLPPAGPVPRLPNGKPDLSGHWN